MNTYAHTHTLNLTLILVLLITHTHTYIQGDRQLQTYIYPYKYTYHHVYGAITRSSKQCIDVYINVDTYMIMFMVFLVTGLSVTPDYLRKSSIKPSFIARPETLLLNFLI